MSRKFIEWARWLKPIRSEVELYSCITAEALHHDSVPGRKLFRFGDLRLASEVATTHGNALVLRIDLNNLNERFLPLDSFQCYRGVFVQLHGRLTTDSASIHRY